MTIPSTVESFIDWTRRPFRIEDADGPSVGVQAAPGFTGGNWSIVQRYPGEILTADKYNADRQTMVDNAVPLMIDDYSATLAQMQAATDPYPGGAPSMAASLAGEIERIRFVLGSLNPAGHWYEVPANGIHPAGGFRLNNNEALLGERADGSYGELIKMGTDDQVQIGADLPAGKGIVLGSDAGGGVSILASLHVAEGANIRGTLTLQKGQWLYWDDIYGIVVDASNNLYLGGNAGSITMQKYSAFPAGAGITNLTVNGHLEVDAGMHVDGGVTADGNVTAGNAFVSTKDRWLWWQDIHAVTVNGSNNWIYIGGNAAGVNLKNTNISGDLQVFGNQYTSGGLTVGGALASNSITVGGVPLGGPSLVRAFARGSTFGSLFSNYGITVWSRENTGVIYFSWTPALGQPCVVATAEEAGSVAPRIAHVDILSSNSARLIVRQHEGNLVDTNVSIIICGQ